MLESEGNTQKCFITSKLWHIILTEGASRLRRVLRCLKRKGYTTFWAVDDHFFQLASTAHPVTMATIEPKKAIFAELEFPQHHVLKFDHPVRGEKKCFLAMISTETGTESVHQSEQTELRQRVNIGAAATERNPVFVCLFVCLTWWHRNSNRAPENL